MKTKLLLLLFLIPLGCKKPAGVEVRYRFYVKNNSGKSVYFHRSNIYPDTTIPNEYFINGNGNIPSGTTAPIDSKFPWREEINKLPADTISIILFDTDTIAHYGWETVRREYKYLKRWNVGADYLEQRNWTLIYPE